MVDKKNLFEGRATTQTKNAKFLLGYKKRDGYKNPRILSFSLGQEEIQGRFLKGHYQQQ